MCGEPVQPDAYSPNATLVQPAGDALLDPSEPIIVRFDVDVLSVHPGTFRVINTVTSAVVSGELTYDAATYEARFGHPEGLPEDATLQVELGGSIFDPVSGRMLRPTVLPLETGDDITPPRVVSIAPVSQATGIGVHTDVTARFSERVLGVSESSFVVFQTSGGVAVTATVTYADATREAVLDPQDQLAPNTDYTVLLSSEITDHSDNVLFDFPFTSRFTTGIDSVAPAVRTTSPANDDTAVAVTANIVVTFDEPVQNVDATSFQVEGGTVTGTITASNGDRTWTFDPDADLPAATTIDVTLSTAITDTSGNALAGFAFAFQTI